MVQKRKIGIFGLSRTGISAYEFLQQNPPQSLQQPEQNLPQEVELICYDDSKEALQLFINKFGTDKVADLHDPRWQGVDSVIVSPGVPLSHQIFTFAKARGIKISSDIDILHENNSAANFIVVTGTNGKSTSTALAGHILKASGINAQIGGNIGIPALSLAQNASCYVLELSSFQLDLISNLTPAIAVLLNITPDHIDRHGSIEEYIKSKEKIFHNLALSAYAIIGVDSEISAALCKKYQALNSFKVIPISAKAIPKNGVCVNDGYIIDCIFEQVKIKLPEHKSLLGQHNAENIAASYAVSRLQGISPEKIVASAADFPSLPHRMQYIGSKNGINFYNDSKATNAVAASKAIMALENIYWLAGGLSKEGGINILAPLFHKIKKAYLFGAAKEEFADSLHGFVEVKLCNDLREAFSEAYKDAQNDHSVVKNILLSPAAASYDQFKNFEERGELFASLAKNEL